MWIIQMWSCYVVDIIFGKNALFFEKIYTERIEEIIFHSLNYVPIVYLCQYLAEIDVSQTLNLFTVMQNLNILPTSI